VTACFRRRTAPPTSARITLELASVSADVLVRRHPRARRASLRITAHGDGVVVIIPPRARIEDGVALARRHAAWICERLQSVPSRVPFADGALLPVSGRPRVVRHGVDRQAGVYEDGDLLVVGGSAAEVAHRVDAWLRAEARRVLADRVWVKAEQLGRAPARVGVRDTRSRWGSCSSTGALSFSWRLILAPPTVLDYVVAHEVAHLRHRGHGPEFWETVAWLTEDMDAARLWLRRHGGDLFRYG
jgi:predicted metal-dependent hydrolase